MRSHRESHGESTGTSGHTPCGGSTASHRRCLRTLGLLVAFAALLAGCGAPFAPPMRGSTMGVAAPGGHTEAAVHGVMTQQGAWEAELRVPLGSNDDVEVSAFGHELPGDDEESFLLPSVGWRHRVPLRPDVQLSTGLGAGLGLGGHGPNWPKDAVHLAGGGYVDGGATWIPLSWLRVYGMVRAQQSIGLTSPMDPEHPGERLERAPPTAWVSAALGTRVDVATAFFGLGAQWAWAYTGSERLDVSGLTASAGWRF